MKKIRIFCNQSFLLEVDSSNYYIDTNNYLEAIYENPTFVKCYPIDQPKTSLPFCFNLKKQQNNIVSNCTNIKIYNFLDRCDIFVSPFLIFDQQVILSTSLTLKNTKYSLVIYPDRIKITHFGEEYIFKTQIQSATFDTQDHCINILTTFKNKKTYTRFDTLQKQFFCILADKIQIQQDYILAQQNFDDFLLHTKVNRYKNIPTLEFESCQFYTQKTLADTNIPSTLVPYVFFENIMLQDYQTATNFLCDELKDSLQKETLKQYFGDIHQISLCCTDPPLYTIYNKSSATDYKIYTQDGKIKEIENK